MVSENRSTPNGRYKGSKTTKYIRLFIFTLTGVVAAGVLIFLIYGMASGRLSDMAGNVSFSQAGSSEASDMDSEGDISDDSYSGREPISGDDPAMLVSSGARTDISPDDTQTADSDVGDISDGSNNSIYSGVHERFGDDLDDIDYLASNNIHIVESRDDDTDNVSITFGGDILFDSSYAVMARLLQNGGEISAGIDQGLIDLMSASDITMVNNEFPYSLRGVPTEGKTFTFRADPSTVHLLTDMGVNAVGLANNHAFDYGEQAFLDTLDTLTEAGMPYCGGGRDISEASAPLYFIADDIKIGIIAATQIERLDTPDTRGATDSLSGVFRCWNVSRLLEVIADARGRCDFLIVFIHWGTESVTELDWAQLEQAPKIAEAGADLIIGAHPHILQPIGAAKGVPVVYSLGNFWFNSKELDTCLVQAEIAQDGLQSLQFIPCRQVGCRTSAAAGDDYTRIINDMRAMSSGVTIDDAGYIRLVNSD